MHVATKIIRRAEALGTHPRDAATVTLTFSERRRNRQRLRLDNAKGEIGLSLEKGLPLCDGDVLVADGGAHIVVKAALEDVVRVTAAPAWHLARAAYHLGNRHVPLEVAEDFLQFEYDPVLVDMLSQLGGVTVERLRAIFQPDIGAYGGGHRHGHDESFQEDYALAQHAYHAHDPGAYDATSHDATHDARHGDSLGDQQEHHGDPPGSKTGKHTR